MPAHTITHKSWCREHQTDYEGEHCFSGGFEFGPMKPALGDFPKHRMGGLFATQQRGVDEEPKVFLEYALQDLVFGVEDLLPLRKAIGDLLALFQVEESEPKP